MTANTSTKPESFVFIDRDGTINIDHGYVGSIERFDLFDHTVTGLKKLYDAGYKIIVVTNQSGVARGYFSEQDVHTVNLHMTNILRENGIIIEDILYCPHHEKGTIEKYTVKCNCRKPDLGLFNIAAAKYRIDKKTSFMIGDKLSDIHWGRKAGLTSILVRTGEGNKTFINMDHSDPLKPHFVVNNLLSAAKLILRLDLSMSGRS